MGLPKYEPIKDVMAELRLIDQAEAFQAAMKKFKADPFLMSERAAAYEARRLYPGPNASNHRRQKAIELRVLLTESPGAYPILNMNRNTRAGAIGSEALKKSKARIADMKQSGTASQSEYESFTLAERIESELQQLAELNPPKNLQRDMDFAYSKMGRRGLLPLESECPSVSAYDLYRFASEPDTKKAFIDKYLAFSQNKEKQEGGSSQEIEDDKRKQFSALKKLAAVVVANVESRLKDMMRLTPEEVIRVMRKQGWTVEQPGA